MSFLTRSRIWGGSLSSGPGGGGGGSVTDLLFNGQRNITRDTPGIDGFDANTTTLITFLNAVFFPAVAPGASISVNNPVREVGQSGAYTLSWEAIANTNPITGINVNGSAVTPTGATQSGTQTGTQSTSLGSTTYNMSDTDGSLSGSASCTIEYLYRMFWGTIAKDGLSDAPILDSDILALANSQLAQNYDLSLSNFGGGAEYLIFAFPTIFGEPSFIVNGLNNTAFTLVRAASPFVNAQGATVLMDVWVSNNVYNSPLGSIILQ